MEDNPMVKPTLNSAPLVVMTRLTGAALLYVVAIIALAWPPALSVWIAFAVVAVAAGLVTWRWSLRIQKRKLWQLFANRQWEYLTRLKGEHETTTEVTVLDFQELQPTGVWATIRWEKFGYIQPAWIEPCSFSIWPQTVLLIRPDPTQIQVGAPWPQTYYVRSHACLATAPAHTRM